MDLPSGEAVRRGTLGLLLLAFALNALLWAAVVTPGYPPDEMSHVGYAQRLFLDHELPVYGVTRYPDGIGFLPHASMPPLYYALVAPLARATGSAETPDMVFLMRVFSVALGALTVACAWRLTRLVVPHRPELALAVGALVGFNPMFTYMSAAVNSDNLVNLVAAALICHLAAALLAERIPWHYGLTLGLILGVGLLAKPTIAAGLGASAVALVLQANRGQTFRWRWLCTSAAATVGGAAAVAGWVYVRNFELYGDPTGIGVIGSRPDIHFAIPYRATGSLAQMLFSVHPDRGWTFYTTMLRGYWGVFDRFSVEMPGRLYGLASRLTLAGVAGLILALAWAWKRRTEPAIRARVAVATVGTTLFLLCLASCIAACYRIDYQPQGRYLFPAIGVVALAVGAGWEQVAALCRAPRLATPTLVSAVLAMNVVALLSTVWPSHLNLYDRDLVMSKARAGAPTSRARLEFTLERAGARRLELLATSHYIRALPVRWSLGRGGTEAPLASGDTMVGGGPFLLSIDVSSLDLPAGRYAMSLETHGLPDSSLAYLSVPPKSAGAADLGVRAVFEPRADLASWRQLYDAVRTGEPNLLRSRLLAGLLVIVPPVVLALWARALSPLAGRWSPLLALALLAAALALAGPPLRIEELRTVRASAVLGSS